MISVRRLHLHHLGFLSASPAAVPLFPPAAFGSSTDEEPFSLSRLSPASSPASNVWESCSLLTFSKCSQQRFLSSAAELFRKNHAVVASVRAG